MKFGDGLISIIQKVWKNYYDHKKNDKKGCENGIISIEDYAGCLEIRYKIGGNIMLNIVVINCDGKYVEYEWDSKKAFVQDMQSDNENIPMLDDPLVEVNTQDNNLQLWWRNTDGMTVDDLLEECKQELN